MLVSLCVILVGFFAEPPRDRQRIRYIVCSIQVQRLAQAAEKYKSDCGDYPNSLHSLVADEGTKCWHGPYVAQEPIDPLGQTVSVFSIHEYPRPRDRVLRRRWKARRIAVGCGHIEPPPSEELSQHAIRNSNSPHHAWSMDWRVVELCRMHRRLVEDIAAVMGAWFTCSRRISPCSADRSRRPTRSRFARSWT